MVMDAFAATVEVIATDVRLAGLKLYGRRVAYACAFFCYLYTPKLNIDGQVIYTESE